MICVSIGRGRAENLLEEHRYLVERGAQLAEWRLDYLSAPVDIEQLIKQRPGPVVATCRREVDGGRYRGSEDERLTLLRHAIVAGVEYVDLEEDVAGNIPRYGPTQRIVSLHNFRDTPQNLAEIHARLAALDADIVKIATMATIPADNLRMLRMIEASTTPTVGLCMGEIGIPSRVLAKKFGAHFTFATFSQERPLAPGQLSFDQMSRVYRYESIDAETKVYGVIGDPIMHSYSPLLHNAAFQELGLNCVYLPFRVPPENLDDFIEHRADFDIHGLSVTIPHKEQVVPKLTEMEPLVEGSGACNTIVFDGEDRRGYNTDISAAIDSLAKEFTEPPDGSHRLADKKILILGSGGVAKAIAYGLTQVGADVTLTGRTRKHVQAAAEKVGCHSIDWTLRARRACHALINCTSVGMHPNVDESPMERHYLKPATVVFDTVYNPESTLLIKHARSQSCKVVTGIEMFVRQAAAQFRLFTEQEPPMDVMRSAMRRAIAPIKLK